MGASRTLAILIPAPAPTPHNASPTPRVSFAPGTGRSSRVVSVSGSFNRGSRARVASFGVGVGPLPASPGVVVTTDDGERVKVLPAATP